MKVLVTGGNGFVGSWLVKRLVADEHDVFVLHRAGSSLEELDHVRFRSKIGDVTDFKSLQNSFSDIDTVFHLAGVVGYSPEMRELMTKVNVGGTENVVRACLDANVRKLVYMSSVVAIGASDRKVLLNENSPFELGPYHLGYFDTKHAAEKIVRDAVFSRGLNAVMVNPSTVYGAGDAKKGSRKVQTKVARGEFPFYPSGGASIVSIHDVIDGIIAAWEKGRSGERYILSGENLLVRDIFKKIAARNFKAAPRFPLPRVLALALGRVGDLLEKVGVKTPITSENARVSSLYHWFDNSKAKRELGFNPRSADAAIAESVDWMKANGYV